jgi:hypothetical protein
VEPPAALDDVRVGGLAIGEGIAVDEGAPLVVRWRTVEGRAAGDQVVVDVSSQSGASVRCAFADDGNGIVPAWVMSSATLGALPATATLAVHRLRQRAFASSGVDVGEVRIDLAVVGRIIVASPDRAFADRASADRASADRASADRAVAGSLAPAP